MGERTVVRFLVEEQTLALWRTDAAFAGIDLGTWLLRRIGSVSPVQRTREDVAALLRRKESAREPPGDEPDEAEIGDAGEEPQAAPAVQRIQKAPRPATRPRTKDLSGQVFGLLTAVRVVGRNKAGYCLWLCRCQCGGEK